LDNHICLPVSTAKTGLDPCPGRFFFPSGGEAPDFYLFWKNAVDKGMQKRYNELQIGYKFI